MSSSRRSRPAVMVLKQVFMVSTWGSTWGWRFSKTEVVAVDALEHRDVGEGVGAGGAEGLAGARVLEEVDGLLAEMPGGDRGGDRVVIDRVLAALVDLDPGLAGIGEQHRGVRVH